MCEDNKETRKTLYQYYTTPGAHGLLIYKDILYNSEWAYQRHRLCYKCDVSQWFYLYPCGFDRKTLTK